MNIQTLLTNAHYTPVRLTATGAMYRAAYRGDTNASLSVDYEKNVFFDFGAADGGDVADLYCLIHNCSIGEALRAVRDGESNAAPVIEKVPQKPRKCPIEVTAYREIRETDATGKYLAEKRGLTYWENLYHVNYINGGRHFFGIGWKSIDGGFHIRSLGTAKFCTSQEISFIENGTEKLIITEGMLDHLSLNQIYPAYRSYDAVILNSVTNASKVIEVAKKYRAVYLLLDADSAGDKATAIILAALPHATDSRSFFSPCNDINEYLQRKLNLKQ